VVAIAPASPAAAVPGSWVVASDGLVHDDQSTLPPSDVAIRANTFASSFGTGNQDAPFAAHGHNPAARRSSGSRHLAHEIATQPLDELLELRMICGLEAVEQLAKTRATREARVINCPWW